ncbi:MAG: nicotinate-nicotinamide nucleotide adenylyltransferase, partial [Candidatus Bipolaricaulaceae bacterium]
PFIVAPRPGVDLKRFREPPFDRAELYFLEMAPIAISSSEVRRRYRLGLPTAGWVPPSVDRFIREHGLYGAQRTSPLE